jgi:hypothetical protein
VTRRCAYALLARASLTRERVATNGGVELEAEGGAGGPTAEFEIVQGGAQFEQRRAVAAGKFRPTQCHIRSDRGASGGSVARP